MRSFPMLDSQWFRSSVVYQIYPRSFSDSNGDGIGDLQGIIERLDYLEELGIDVIWLSPIYTSPQDDNGYDISDYQNIDPMFGTLEEFDALVIEAKRRNIKIVMDLVVNHCSDEHPWFIESKSSVDNPKRDWFYWSKPRPGHVGGESGAEPTNWGSWFSGPAWEFDPASGEYYLHLFSRKQPDLNWENRDVRFAVYQMMNWWLDRGINGFRMDVINLISKVLPLTDGILYEGAIYGDGSAQFISGPRMHEWLQEMHREVFADRPEAILTVGETPGVSVDEAKLITDPARQELDMVFQFEHMGIDQGGVKWKRIPFDLMVLKRVLDKWQQGLAEVGWNSLYWNNHDQPRVVSRFGDDGVHRVASAKALATILHCQRGTPYVYQGEELAMTNTRFNTIEDFRDLESINHFNESVSRGDDPEQVLQSMKWVARDNARTPMQWDATEHAGFTTGVPWIDTNPNCRDINAAAELANPDSVFHHYRKLISLRKTEPAIADGTYELLLPEDPDIYAYIRTNGSTQLLIVANCSSHDVEARVPVAAEWLASEVLLCSGTADPATFMLAAWESRIYRRTV